MTPPQLARDAPVLDIAHPGEIHVLVLLGHELDAAVFHRGNRLLGQRLGRYIPLVGQPGFDNHPGAVALGYLECVRLDLFQQPGGVKVGDNLLARLEAVQPGIGGRQAGVECVIDAAIDVEHLGAGKNRRILVEDIDQRQGVALADLVVVEVVGRGDLHATGAKFRITVIVAHDRNASTDQWQLDELADQRLVAFIFRVNGDRAVAQHGFRACGGNNQIVLAVGGGGAISQRVAQIP